MSRVLLVLIVVLALVGGGLWFGAGERGPRAAQPVESALAQPVRAATDVAPPPVVASTPVPGAAPAPASAPATREVAAGTLAAELAGASWVEGRVVLPPGTPLDEVAFVVADGKDFADGKDQRARVAADGAFRVAFSAETRNGWLRLEARYLYLDEAVRWKRGAGAEPVLEPSLGARIEGHVTLPAGADAGAPGGTVQLHEGDEDGGWDRQGRAELGRGLAFVFEALRCRRAVRLSYDGAEFVGHGEGFVLEPGKTLAVELALQPGVVLSGVVRDESGAPLGGVRVEADRLTEDLRRWGGDEGRSATTPADGTFRLGAMAPGEFQLEASLDGYRPVQQKLSAKNGARLADLALVLGRGNSIAGSVRWPDGTPAEAVLSLSPIRTARRWDPTEPDVQGHSDASGRFEVTGLGNAAYRVKAQAVKREEVLVKSELTGKERKKTQRSQWSAEATDIAVGTNDLALTLSTGLELAGRVVDDLGQTLAAFRVRATPAGESTFIDELGNNGPGRSFRDTDGSFVLQGFAPGEWDVTADCADHAASEPVRVSMPAAGALMLVVPREAVLGGVVLDASGAAVEDATVNLEEAERRAKGPSRDVGSTRTDAQGAFRLARLGPGKVRLSATGSAGAPSAPRELELVPGQTLENLVLRLEPATLVTGEVVSSGGLPLPGVVVWAYSARDFSEDRETDGQGRFEFANVPAGELNVSAKLPEGLRLSASVTVATGASAHVRLSPPDQLVHLRGRVQAGGEPLAEANLYASALAGDTPRSNTGSSAQTDADGAYALELPGAGRYQLHVSTWKEQQLSWSVRLDVPEVESLVHDVSIPLGRISGRVTDAAGNAVRIAVQSEPEQHDGGAGAGSTLTDEDGRYELLVPAGRHAVRAGGGKQRAESPYAEARVGGLVVAEGAHLRGVDLVLVAGGALEGRVRRADGSPTRNAQLLTEQDGHTRFLGRCDASGDFHLEGLAPGALLVRAMDQGAATREPVRVEIVAGETRRVEFELVPAVWVHLTVRDARGTLLGSELSAVDANGRRQMIQSEEAGDAWLGPLPPGHYTVRAQRDEKTVERELDVTGKEEKLPLELVFE